MHDVLTSTGRLQRALWTQLTGKSVSDKTSANDKQAGQAMLVEAMAGKRRGVGLGAGLVGPGPSMNTY